MVFLLLLLCCATEEKVIETPKHCKVLIDVQAIVSTQTGDDHLLPAALLALLVLLLAAAAVAAAVAADAPAPPPAPPEDAAFAVVSLSLLGDALSAVAKSWLMN